MLDNIKNIQYLSFFFVDTALNDYKKKLFINEDQVGIDGYVQLNSNNR